MQVVELDFLYPSEGIHRRWDGGYRITSTAATWDQAAFVLSVPRRKPADETQETLRTSAFPSTHVKVGSLRYLFMLIYLTVFLFIFSYAAFISTIVSIHMVLPFFPLVLSCVLQEKWAKNLYIASVCYGRTVS